VTQRTPRFRWLLIPLVLFALLPLVARRMAYEQVEKSSLISRPVGPETPATFGAPFTTVRIPRGSYTLNAVVCKVNDRAPVVVIFHGTAESVSYWADVQALLWKAGISSYVFDYSGFGNSGGERKAVAIAEDVSQAWKEAATEFPFAQRRLAVAYSLGTGFLVSEYNKLVPAPQGLALIASYSSAREAAVAFGSIPRWAAPILPDLWNTVDGIGTVNAPVLFVHSDADQIFPLAMPRRIFKAANEPKAFVRLSGYKHEDGHLRPDRTFWASVMTFAQTGRLPQSNM
jgi:uncharacterized protein